MRHNVGVLFSALVLSFAAGGCGSSKTDFTLTVQKSGAGTVSGGGISCGTSCTATVASGTSVTLMAMAEAGSNFTGWTGCDSSDAMNCTVKMNADRTVGATFVAANATVISSDITVPTTWPAGGVYRVTKPINVTAALTIQPGVVVKFDPGASFDVTGSLLVDGQAAGTPVVFTSSSATPAGGDWAGIKLGANGSTFNQCQVLYAGANGDSALKIEDGFSATITHCTFAHHKTPTDTIDASPALDASGAALATVIRDNLFFDNRTPLSVNTTFSVEPNLFDNSAAVPASPQANKYNAVVVAGCGHVKGAISWPALAVPYVIGDSTTACNYLVVDGTGTLTIGATGANAVVKFFKGGRISSDGVTNGHAIFTSIADDRLGDTNGDGAATAAAAGDWAGLTLRHNGSSFDGSSFFYTGEGDTSAIAISTGITATVTHSTFGHHKPTITTVRSAPALDASDASAASVIQANTFFDTTVPLAMNTTLSIDDSNTFTGADADGAVHANVFQAIVVTGCGHVTGNVSWSAVKVPLVVGDPDTACNYVAVDAAGHLTISDNVVVKFFGGGSIRTSGLLTALGTTGITFTSFKDDAHGGDTNADGAATTATAGDWSGITLSLSGSAFAHCNFLYGGNAGDGGNNPALSVASSKSVSVTDSVFAHNRTATATLHSPPALDLSDAAATGTVIERNRFFDNTVPLAINGTISLDDSNFFDSGNPSAYQLNQYPGVVVQGCSQVTSNTIWMIAKAPLVIGESVSACNYLTIPGGGHLTLGPGVTLKFFTNGALFVSVGGLLTIDPTCWLTCISDDHLGDTNGDGLATWPAAGDWSGVKVSHSGASPTCDQGAYMHWQKPNNGAVCSW